MDRLKEIESDSVDSLVTDPPAGIGFMGKDWDKDKGGREQWVSWLSSVMRECHRVLKPGAHGLVWALPRTSHWTATALEDAGFEVRDVITHLFGQGFPKSYNIGQAIEKTLTLGVARRPDRNLNKGRVEGFPENKGFQNLDTGGAIALTTEAAKEWNGWGTALKPAVEMWLLVAKPFISVPVDAMVSEINSILRDFVCLKLGAKFAESVSKSNPKDLNAGLSDFVQWIAAVKATHESVEKSEQMDTFKLLETVRTCSNIAQSWNNILADLFDLRSKSITEMETALITELKILRFSILENTRNITTREEIEVSGSQLSANLVNASLKSASLRLVGLKEIFAPESVSTRMEDLLDALPNPSSYESGISKAVLSEHAILIRKPINEKNVAANVLEWGVGGINVDGCRIEVNDGARLGRNNGDSNGWKNSSGGDSTNAIREKQGLPQLGRFPANLVLSHSPYCTDVQCDIECAVKSLDQQSGPCKSGGASTGRGFQNEYVGGFVEKEVERPYIKDKDAGASRFFYCAKVSASERGEGNSHPTVKAQKLMRYLCRLVTPSGGVVLDPFMGSGSTGMAAKSEGFEFIGIEQEPEYFEIAKRRIESVGVG